MQPAIKPIIFLLVKPKRRQIVAVRIHQKNIQNTSSYSSSTKDVSLGKIKLDLDWAHASAGVSISGKGSQSQINENSVTQVSSNVESGGSLLFNVDKDLNVIASNVEANGQADVNVIGNTNILTAQNMYNYSNSESSLTIEVGAKVGNAYVDTGYAGYGLYEATKQLKDNTDKLNQLKDLQSQGKASQHAVDIAGVAVAMATVNLANATLQMVSSAIGAAASSQTAGFYVAAYANMTAQTSETKHSSSEAVGSNFVSNGDFNLNSNNANIKGSVIGSVNGKTNVDVSGDLKLTQGESYYSMEQKSYTHFITIYYKACQMALR